MSEPVMLSGAVATQHPGNYFEQILQWSADDSTNASRLWPMPSARAFRSRGWNLGANLPISWRATSLTGSACNWCFVDIAVTTGIRDAVQAKLRNVVRVVLRKYGYPQALREQVTEQVLARTKLTDGGDGQ